MKNKIIVLLSIFVIVFLNIFMYNYNSKGMYVYDNTKYLSYIGYNNFTFESNKKYIQTIYSERKNLAKIKLYVNPIDHLYDNDGYISVYLKLTLRDSKNRVIQSYKYEKVFIKGNNAYLEFKFDKLKNSKNKIYYLEIESISNILNDTPVIFTNIPSSDNNYQLKIDNKNSGYTMLYDTEYFNCGNKTNYFIVLLIITTLFIGVSLCLFKYRNMRIENKYMMISLLVGLLSILIFPTFYGADELSHFARSYELSNGNLITNSVNGWPSTKIPSKIKENNFTLYDKLFNDDNLRINISKKDTVLYNMEYTSVYSILSYLPQTLGMLVCKIFGISQIVWIYIIRIFQLIFCVCLVYHAIRIIPYGKENVMFIAMTLGVTKAFCLISADAILVCSSLLFIAKLLQLKETNEIQKRDIILLMILSILISISKLVYAPLCLISIVILKHKNKKDLSKYLVFFIGIPCLITITWNTIAMSSLVSGQGVNVIYYLKYYLRHPFDYILININTIIKLGGKYVCELFGGTNKWYNMEDSSIYYILFCGLYFYIGLNSSNNLSNKQKFNISLIVITVYILIATSLLLTCTPVYYDYIVGIQGRYLLPFLLPISLVICKTRSNKKRNRILNNIDFILLIIYFAYILENLLSFM